ncbi:MAG: cell division protein ZapA [Methylovulum sp.]|jgi:cell division protein ZapA|nr:cell division protein ZapA [Methylovulum sp.]TSA39861.1 MAG: cell division protein ZapA [Methylococcaceae bacterium]
MADKAQSITLMIMGKEYRILCDSEEQDELIQSALQLDNQMRKLRDSGKINGADRIAVMTALNIAHELQVLKNQHERVQQELDDCLSQLHQKLDDVLNHDAY